jgi:branched-chain amino acid transport system permease protein
VSVVQRFSGRLGVPLVLFLGVVLVTVLASQGPASTDRLVVVALINVVFTVGLYLFVGNSGVWSFGHMSFALIGAYTAGILVMPSRLKEQLLPDAPEFLRQVSLDPWAAVVAAGVLAAVVGAVVAVPLSRIGGLSAGLATVSLLIAFTVIAAQWQDVTRGQKGLSSIPTSTTTSVALTWVLIALVVAWTYQRSSFGVRLRATRSDEIAAAASGISIPVQRGAAFVLSAFFTGVGGGLFALLLGSVNPDVFYLDYTFLVITMLVLGGAGSLTGAVLGTVVVSVLSEVLRQAEAGSVLGLVDVPPRPGIADVVLGILLVLMLLRRSAGLTGGREIRWPGRRRRAGADPSAATSAPEGASAPTRPDAVLTTGGSGTERVDGP